MRVHVLQIAYGDGESLPDRVERVADWVLGQRGADLVVLPELWANTGFDYSRWNETAQSLEGPIVQAIAAAAREIGATVHAGSIIEAATDDFGREPPAERVGRGRFNTAVVLDPAGAIAATYRKMHLFGFTSGEPEYLDAGDEVVTFTLGLRPAQGASAASGSSELLATSVTAGLATCYDLRFPELFRRLGLRGTELVIVPAAWPQARVEHWSLLGRARAVENQMVVVQCNTAGTHAGVAMGGRSQVVAADGTVLAEAGVDEETLVVEVDLEATRAYRTAFPVLRDRRLP